MLNMLIRVTIDRLPSYMDIYMYMHVYILCCNVCHRLKVQAVNGIGCGPLTPTLRVTTHALPPSPPTLRCEQAAPNNLKLKWGDGRNSEQLDYCLEMLKNNKSVSNSRTPFLCLWCMVCGCTVDVPTCSTCTRDCCEYY